MLTGSIAKVDPEKGFGFIKQQDGGDVFFHHSVLRGQMTKLREGQVVQFEIDDKADKPRAKFVATDKDARKPLDSQKPFGSERKWNRQQASRDNQSRGDQRAARSRFGHNRPSDRPQGRSDRFERRVPDNCVYGHIVRLFRNDRQGKISATTGGPEILFEQKAVAGQTFGSLEIGQYVQFAIKRETAGTKQPEAFFVQAAERISAPTIGQMARHPKARAKKPTWRKKV